MRALTYADQDGDRRRLAEVCARGSAEVLRLVDSFVGPETFADAEYRAFRERIAPEICAILLADVAGAVVGGLDVEPDGRASFDVDVEGLTVYQPPVDVDPLLYRVAWLCAEVPSMDRYYGQLYPKESARLAEIVGAAKKLDFERQADRDQAAAMLDELEVFHLWAHPGGRLMRKDPASIATFLERVGALAPLVMAADAKNRHLRAVLDGTEEPQDPAEARRVAVAELASVQAEEEALSAALNDTRGRRERLTAAVARLTPRPAAPRVCGVCGKPLSATPAGPVCYPCGWAP